MKRASNGIKDVLIFSCCCRVSLEFEYLVIQSTIDLIKVLDFFDKITILYNKFQFKKIFPKRDTI